MSDRELFAAEIGGAAIGVLAASRRRRGPADQGSPVYSAIGIRELAHVDIEGMVIDCVLSYFFDILP